MSGACGNVPDGGRATGRVSRSATSAGAIRFFLKLHAAVDRDGGRHLQDLLDLKPTASELLDAAKWTRTQDSSDGFRLLLGEMLKHLGHADLVAQL